MPSNIAATSPGCLSRSARAIAPPYGPRPAAHAARRPVPRIRSGHLERQPDQCSIDPALAGSMFHRAGYETASVGGAVAWGGAAGAGASTGAGAGWEPARAGSRRWLGAGRAGSEQARALPFLAEDVLGEE